MSKRLRSQILSCHRCELGDYSDSQEWHRVPWSGPNRADVVVVGEAPGKNEALTGSPFVGKAGKVLDLALESIGLSHEKVWLMNLICCRPQANDFSKAEEAEAVAACRPWFNQQLDASSAWLVVLAGKKAYQAVFEPTVKNPEPIAISTTNFYDPCDNCGKPVKVPERYKIPTGPGTDKRGDGKGWWVHVECVDEAIDKLKRGEGTPLGRVRGKFSWFGGKLWLPTWHPAYVLRQGNQGKVTEEFFADWKGVGQVLSGDVSPPSPSLKQTIPGQLELHYPGEDIRDRIERKGWVRIYSKTLDDHMLIVDGKKGPKIPEAWKGEPRWTTEELMRIGYGSKLRISVQQLQKINLAKRALGAEIVA